MRTGTSSGLVDLERGKPSHLLTDTLECRASHVFGQEMLEAHEGRPRVKRVPSQMEWNPRRGRSSGEDRPFDGLHWTL